MSYGAEERAYGMLCPCPGRISLTFTLTYVTRLL